MGLTIHYKLRLVSATARQAGALVRKLHRRAAALPFRAVSPIAEYSAGNGGLAGRPEWFVEEIDLMARERGGRVLLPRRAFAFEIIPGLGCETATFGLAQYPRAIVRADGRRVATNLSGWRWQDFCKTQYASNPRLGGWANFRRCHTSLIALLDAAKEIGLRTEVLDESGFATRRDVEHLAREVAQWNEMMAGFVGQMKDALPGEFEAPIARFPDFEHLEARGRDKSRRLAPD
jgi:hypothetical protein